MKNNNGAKSQLSYESDGKMGNNKKAKNNKKDQVDFFNVTQNSE